MYMSAKQAGEKWNISERRVRILCSEGRVDGVVRSGWAWNIPIDTPKPGDGRQLRHLKNFDLRAGTMNFSQLDEERDRCFSQQEDRQQILRSYRHLVNRFILGSFACEELSIEQDELFLLFSHCFAPSLDFDTQLLALNCRSILMRFVQETGLGPIPQTKTTRPFFSEQRLRELYRSLLQGIDDEHMGIYRKGNLPSGGDSASSVRLYTVATQMETLMTQYEREWASLHPVVRSLFFYGELLRIRPFGRYDEVFASLVLAGELLCGGFPPAFVDVRQIDEFKAALILTRKRGNYHNALRMLEQSLLHELALMMHKE